MDDLALPRLYVHPEPDHTAVVFEERLAAGYGDDDLFVIGWQGTGPVMDWLIRITTLALDERD